MDFPRPGSWEKALAAKAGHSTGGTDAVVEPSLDHRRPEHPLDLNRVDDRHPWEVGQRVRLGVSVLAAQPVAHPRGERPGPPVDVIRAPTTLTRVPFRAENLTGT